MQLDLLAGPMIDPYGPGVVPANRSAPPARGSAKPMLDTSGPLWGDLSPSAGLQLSLASRLQARLGGDGSPEYGLTWKAWAIGSGPPICALRASGRRTSGNACSGWPTPNAGPQNDGDSTWEARRARIKAERKNGNGFGMTLGMAAQTAGWATPRSEDAESAGMRHSRGKADTLSAQAGQDLAMAGWATPTAHDQSPRGAGQKAKHGTKHGCTDLNRDAQMAGWATPTVQDAANTAGPSQWDRNSAPLNVQAAMAGWNTPRATDGTHGGPNQTGGALPADAAVAGLATPVVNDATGSQYAYAGGDHAKRVLKLPGMARAGSPAATGKRGALNPALSLWLMGFPSDWLMVAPSKRPRGRGSSRGSGTPSSRKSRPSS